MANRTDTVAQQVHGTDPQNLIDLTLRYNIYESNYWLQTCHGLDPLTIIDNALQIEFIGAQIGSMKRPTEFVCLLLKLLQIQPSMRVMFEYLKQDEHKYLRVLAAFYIRLVGKPFEIYRLLEPLYTDYRKVRILDTMGDTIELTTIDQLIHQLLTTTYINGIQLPAITPRWQLERDGMLKPRQSWLMIDNEHVTLDSIADIDMSSIDVENPYYTDKIARMEHEAQIQDAIENGARLMPDGTLSYGPFDDDGDNDDSGGMYKGKKHYPKRLHTVYDIHDKSKAQPTKVSILAAHQAKNQIDDDDDGGDDDQGKKTKRKIYLQRVAYTRRANKVDNERFLRDDDHFDDRDLRERGGDATISVEQLRQRRLQQQKQLLAVTNDNTTSRIQDDNNGLNQWTEVPVVQESIQSGPQLPLFLHTNNSLAPEMMISTTNTQPTQAQTKIDQIVDTKEHNEQDGPTVTTMTTENSIYDDEEDDIEPIAPPVTIKPVTVAVQAAVDTSGGLLLDDYSDSD